MNGLQHSLGHCQNLLLFQPLGHQSTKPLATCQHPRRSNANLLETDGHTVHQISVIYSTLAPTFYLANRIVLHSSCTSLQYGLRAEWFAIGRSRCLSAVTPQGKETAE
jgi:hypothetical protein